MEMYFHLVIFRADGDSCQFFGNHSRLASAGVRFPPAGAFDSQSAIRRELNDWVDSAPQSAKLAPVREMIVFVGLALGGCDLLDRGPSGRRRTEILSVHFIESTQVRQIIQVNVVATT